MRKVVSLLKQLREQIMQQRDNIDEFSRNNMATATDLSKVEYYAGLVKKQVDYLEHYLQEYAKASKKDPTGRKSAKENVMLQEIILRVTYEAFTEQLNALTQKTDFQIAIDGKMTEQKKRMNTLLDKAQKIISPLDKDYRKV